MCINVNDWHIKESLIERPGKRILGLAWHWGETKSNTRNNLPPDFLLYEKDKPYQFKGLFVEYSATFNWNHSWLTIVPNYSLALLPIGGLCIFTCCHVTNWHWLLSVEGKHILFPLLLGLAMSCTLDKRHQQFLPTSLFFSLCHDNGVSAMRMPWKWLLLQCVSEKEKTHGEQTQQPTDGNSCGTWVTFGVYLLPQFVTKHTNTKSIPEMGMGMWYALTNRLWLKVT